MKRTPKQIRSMLQELEDVWRRHPEQSLAVLVSLGCLTIPDVNPTDKELLKSLRGLHSTFPSTERTK